MKERPTTDRRPLPTTEEWIGVFRQRAEPMSAMASRVDAPSDPSTAPEPMALHNMYVRALICAYARRFGELSHAVAENVEAGRCHGRGGQA